MRVIGNIRLRDRPIVDLETFRPSRFFVFSSYISICRGLLRRIENMLMRSHTMDRRALAGSVSPSPILRIINHEGHYASLNRELCSAKTEPEHGCRSFDGLMPF